MALPDPWKLNNDKPFELDKDGAGWSFPTKNPIKLPPPFAGPGNKKPGPGGKPPSIGLPNPDVPKDPRYNQTNIAVDKFAQNVKAYIPNYEAFDPKGRTKNPQGPDRDEYRYYYGRDWDRKAPPLYGDGLMGNTAIGGTGAIDWETINNRGRNQSRGQSWRDAASKADARLQHSERTGRYSTELSALRPAIQAEESFNTDIQQTGEVDNTFENNFGNNNTFGPGSSVGNNNSVTIISQGGQGLNNMQSVAAYKALNNNEFEKSQQRMNGYGRTAGAIDQAENQLGIVDRVSSIYNMAGLSQAYWNDKSLAHQADYLGDIWKTGGFKYQMPGVRKRLEDKTEEIADSMDFGD